jgi:hypothetical protein
MDEPSQPFAVPPGAPNQLGEPDASSAPAGASTAPATPVTARHPVPPVEPWAAAPPTMPPLGPPYATPATPPPPTFPSAPPETWPATPPLLPTAPPANGPGGGGGGRRDFGDPRKRALAIAALGGVALLIVGLLAWRQSNENSNGRFIAGAPSTTQPVATDSSDGTDSSNSSDSGAGGSNSTDSSDSSSSSGDLQSTVLDIQAFVEKQRGLKFKQDVDVQLVDDNQLAQLLQKDFDKERPSILETQEVLRALALISPKFDLTNAEQTLLDTSVLGFYDPETKKLVVRGTDVTPFTRDTLAHELTHALDDQWFDLNRPQLDTADDETGFAFTALVEGDAVRVEEAYLKTMSASDRADVTKEQQDLLLAHPEIFSMPQVLIDMTQEPYSDGPRLVNAILDAGQQPRLDAAFQQPPTTSEQVIDPDKFLNGEGAVPVPFPTADGTVSNKGVLGAYMLEELLLGSMRTNEVDNAIAGWGGDSYVTWADPRGKRCLRDAFVGDTPNDTAQLAQALSEWAPDAGAVVNATPGQPGTFTVCN